MLKLPKGSCDSQIHIFADTAKYPVRHAMPLYVPPAGEGTIERALEMYDELGIDRFVIVNATIYKTDATILCDTLRALPTGKARGVCIVDDTVTDRQLADMHDAGVRGARFNFQARFGLVPDFAEFHRQIARISELGWFAKIFCGMTEMALVAEELRKTKITLVIDHMGQLDFSHGLAQPGMKLILDFLRDERFWMMLSNGDRWAKAYPWDEAVPFGDAFYAAAPDRCVWGSDWPNVARWIRRDPPYAPHPSGEAGKVELALRYLPDAEAVQNVFVDNPSRLFGF